MISGRPAVKNIALDLAMTVFVAINPYFSSCCHHNIHKTPYVSLMFQLLSSRAAADVQGSMGPSDSQACVFQNLLQFFTLVWLHTQTLW